MPSGRSLRIWSTAFFTSLTAALMSSPISNSALTVVMPSLELASMLRTPCTLRIADSTFCVICVVISVGAAPGCEIETTTTAEVTDLNPGSLLTSKTSLYKQKCKIWLDIGNLFLFKFSDPHEAFKYFEMVLKTALDTNDLLLNSLTLGNLGLCKQKNGEYETALDYFKEQLLVLDKKLKTKNEYLNCLFNI